MPKEDDATCFSKLKEEVTVRLPQCIEHVLGQAKEYNQKFVDDWSETLGQHVLETLQSLSANFKYIVNVAIMEKKGAGFHTSTATFWDPESDAAVSYRWENKAMVAIVQVYGVGM
eukprot:TRINITY_DN23808_c0_g1_i1.p1 TRINITY_DN23808_c0_g1~~TRINITY_DN23808_c0_g1_i1.p1  ORF type:complete len:115 (+),score=21.01 TRINITY_DN23808_c0_g1_i1:110-454(+)